MAADANPSTRIIVKNLPKYVDAARVREHFSTVGDVTDVKLQTTKCAATSPMARALLWSSAAALLAIYVRLIIFHG